MPKINYLDILRLLKSNDRKAEKKSAKQVADGLKNLRSSAGF